MMAMSARLTDSILPARPQDHSFHAAYARMLCDLLREAGGDADAMLNQAGLCWAEVERSEELLPLELAQHLVRSVQRLVPRPTLALELGSRTLVSSHGPMGYALASSANLRQALEVLDRFTCIRTRAVREYGRFERGGAWLVIEPVVDLADIRAFVLDHIVAAKSSMIATLSGRSLRDVLLELPWRAPPWKAAYAPLAGRVRFGAERAALWIPDAMLDAPCATASASTFASAWKECEAEEQRQQARHTLAMRVARLLREGVLAAHSLAGVAAQLGLSARTLNRRLQAEYSSFKALMDAERRRRALWLLTQTERQVAEVAAAVGYTDGSNFRRSCQRWFGRSPRDLRAETRAANGV